MFPPASGGFDQCGNFSITSLEADQGARVEDDAHSSDPLAASSPGPFEASFSFFHLGVGERTELVLP